MSAFVFILFGMFSVKRELIRDLVETHLKQAVKRFLKCYCQQITIEYSQSFIIHLLNDVLIYRCGTSSRLEELLIWYALFAHYTNFV